MWRYFLVAYLAEADAVGTVPLVLDLRITYDRWGSTSNPLRHGHFQYPGPDDIDRPLNKAATAKIRDYRADYNKCPANSFFHDYCS